MNIERGPNFGKSHEPKQKKTQPSKNLVLRLAVAVPAFLGVILASCDEDGTNLASGTETLTSHPTPIETLIPTPVDSPLIKFDEVDEEINGKKDGIINIADLRQQRQGKECLACLDINADGRITEKDVGLIQRRIDNQELPFHPRFDPAEPFGSIDDKDVQAVTSKIGRVVPSEEGGIKLSELYYGWKADQIELAVKPDTSKEEIERLESKYGLNLSNQTGSADYLNVPEEVLKEKTLGELIEQLLKEESVLFVGRVSIGTIEDF